MYDQFKSLFPNLSDEQVLPKYEAIRELYGEPHRHYHTLDHIKACLSHLEDLEGFDDLNSFQADALEDKRALQLAFWFHDVIYHPLKNNNELKSAEYAQRQLRELGESGELIKKVSDLILLTIHPSSPITSDEAYLIDIDLSILGAAPELYQQYEGWIRKEYKTVPSFLFNKGRKKLLKSFLAQEKIFVSEWFHAKFEQNARDNLRWAIEQL